MPQPYIMHTTYCKGSLRAVTLSVLFVQYLCAFSYTELIHIDRIYVLDVIIYMWWEGMG